MHLIKTLLSCSNRTKDSLMQLGLDCHSSAAPHSATLVPALQENREALMAALPERVQKPDKPKEFIHYSKLSHKTSTQVPVNILHTREMCLLCYVFFSSLTVGIFCLCQLFHQYKVLNSCYHKFTHTRRPARICLPCLANKKGYFQWNTDMMLFKSSEWSVRISSLWRPGGRTNNKLKTVTSRIYSFIMSWLEFP